jgi:hypothetical protein
MRPRLYRPEYLSEQDGMGRPPWTFHVVVHLERPALVDGTHTCRPAFVLFGQRLSSGSDARVSIPYAGEAGSDIIISVFTAPKWRI